jgi:uncharacterized membrane protein YeaQ/YmgE (transglycosylase-associated protein family)
VLILAIIVAGMFIGWIAQLLLGANRNTVDWGMALIAGIGGSFVGGLLASLVAGDGLKLRPSGVIGSLLGALLVTVAWQYARRRQAS